MGNRPSDDSGQRLGRRAYLKASLVTGTGLVGCLGSGSGGDSILIGNLSPSSGGLGWIGPNVRSGVKTALEGEGGVNRAKIDGKTVEMEEEDTETDPETAISGFRALDDKGVPTMLGPSSAVTRTLFRPALTARLSFVSPMTGTTELDHIGGTYIWRTVPSDAIGARAQARFAYEEQGLRKMALAYKNRKGTYSFSNASGDYFTDLGGEVVTEATLNLGASDYRPAVRTIQESAAEVVSLTAGTDVTGQFIRDYVALGAEDDFALLLGNDALSPAFLEEMGPDTMAGMVGQTPAAGPANDEFTERHRRVNDTDPGTFASSAYDAMNLIGLAFVKEGETNRDAVPNHLREIGNPPGEKVTTFATGKEELNAGNEINYVGAANPQNFTERGDPLGSFAVLRVTDGSWQEVKKYSSDDLSTE